MNQIRTPLRTSTFQNAMIVALEPVEFVPCGRRIVGNHPGVGCLHIHQSQGLVRLDRSLVGSFSKVTLDDKSTDSEICHLRKYDNAEEELYVSGHTLVWSRGSNVINTFTIDSPVRHAIWCSFVVDADDPHLYELCSAADGKKKVIEGFAAVSDGSLHVFTREGDDFVTSLPFQVCKIWKCDFGIIFERSQSQSSSSSVGMTSIAESTIPAENALTTVFCLQHPLREFAPVVKKVQGSVKYMNRSRESIVFCEENLVMTFDTKHGLHTVWEIRKMNQDDANSLENNLAQQQQIQNQLSSIRQMSISSPGTSPMHASFRGSPAASVLPNIGGGNIGLTRTPHANKNPSFAHLSHTPNSSRLCSPSAAPMNYASHTFSPLRHSPHIVRSPSTPISHESLCLNDTVHESAEPLRPEICFEHVWSETIGGTREGLNTGPATRAFLTEDICGQKFLAYYIDSLRQLRIVKYGLSNDWSQFIFGAVTSLPARDAVTLKELKMIAVLDLSGMITLYTGNVKMLKLHVTGVPVLSLSLSHGLRNATPSLGTPQPVSTPAHPSRPGSVLGNTEEVGMLSPVPELALTGETDLILHTVDEYPFSSIGQTSSSIMSLPHVVGNSLLLEVSNGSLYKTDVPQLCTTSLVKTCMKALHHVLPSDTYMQLITKWYAMRHCPGSMASYQSEWAIFETCLREIMGYSNISSRRTNRLNQMDGDTSVSPVIAPKKARHLNQGNCADWGFLCQSDHHKNTSDLLSGIFNGIFDDDVQSEIDMELEEPKFELMNRSKRRSSLDRSTDRTTGVHPLCPVFCALHLVYEDQKLNIMTWENTKKMSKFLQQLANDIGMYKFSKSYALDNPDLIKYVPSEEKEFDPQVFRLPNCFSADMEPNIFINIYFMIVNGACPAPFPVIPSVTERTKHILMIFDHLFTLGSHGPATVELGSFVKSSVFKKEKSIEMEEDVTFDKETSNAQVDASQRALKYMVEAGLTSDDLFTLPHGVSLPILMALHQCKELPDLDLPKDALELTGRRDLLHQNSPEMVKWKDAALSTSTDPRRSAWQPVNDSSRTNDQLDGNHEILATVLDDDVVTNGNKGANARKPEHHDSADDNVTRLLFPNDHRISDVHRLLQSEKPIKFDLTPQAGVSAAVFTEQTKARLLQICNRTMALAVGRGMVSLQTEKPVPIEPLQIPKMDLTGRCMPGNTTVDLESAGSELQANAKEWPLFHNGVAAGVKIMPQTNDTSWIYQNKSEGTASNNTRDVSPEHAGFLLAAGLNGHIEKFHTLKIHDYLTRTHEMTTIALLLGLGAAKCGSCDVAIMRLLSVHVPALLPKTSTEFDVPRTIQTAAVTAVGFLYLGSGQRLVAEVMLREIDRPPAAENDDGQGREAYALSCGIALGAVTLGRGGSIPELADLNIPDMLYHYVTGKRKHSTEPNSQSVILEGDQINTEVTGPGAIIALTLMFLKTNNLAIADWFTAPDTLLLLEMIKPQHLMLRILARNLILWDHVEPDRAWVESHVPEVIRSHIFQCENPSLSDEENLSVDAQTILQCHAVILAGSCLAIGIRFAGSQSKAAYHVLHHYINFFLSIWNEQTSTISLEFIGRYTLETCLTTCLLALSMVVAGSGDLELLQICRFLHVKLGSEVNYGTQMAIHMALGFLFLGGCRKTLHTSNKAIAALLTSIFPCFPFSSTDNQYHLQALRHFYVLATEQRLLVPIDNEMNLPCYAQIEVKFLPELYGGEHRYTAMAPCMLPELSQLKEVSVCDPRHWPLVVDVRTQPDKLRQLLECGMSVQRRTGFQTYIQDPKGHRSYLARSADFGASNSHWDSLLSDSNFNTKTFAQVYLRSEPLEDGCTSEAKNTAHLSSLLKDLVTQEKTKMLYVFCGLQQICDRIHSSRYPNPLAVWQLKIAIDFMKRDFVQRDSFGKDPVNGMRFLTLLSTEVEGHFEMILEDLKPILLNLLGLKSSPTKTTRPKREPKRKYLSTESLGFSPSISQGVTSYDATGLWKLTSYCIFNSLPLSLLFPKSSEPQNDKLLDALKRRGIRGKGAAQIYKALNAV